MATVERETLASPAEIDSLYEIIDGQFVEKQPMAAFAHELTSVLHDLLSPFVRANGLGRILTEMLFDFRPGLDRQRRPEVALLSAQRWPLNQRSSRTAPAWSIVPDLAVEIVSPSNSPDEVVRKIDEYFRVGVRLVWVVYPENDSIYVYESPNSVQIKRRGDQVDGGSVVPGFRMSVDDLFGPVEESTA